MKRGSRNILTGIFLILFLSTNFVFAAESGLSVENGRVSDEIVAVTGISLEETAMTIKVGESRVLAFAVAPGDASNQQVVWTSSDEAVLTVDDNGVAVGLAEGVAIIAATTIEGGFTAECIVDVREEPVDPSDETGEDLADDIAPDVGNATNDGAIVVTSISFEEKAVAIRVGESRTLTIHVKPENAPNQLVAWTSNDEAVAVVDEYGAITGLAQGVTTIAATMLEGGLVAECIVEVREALNNDPQLLLRGQADEVTDRFIVKYKAGAEKKIVLNHAERLHGKLASVKQVKAGNGQDYEVISLADKVKASEFIEALDIGGKDVEIEYIQPDYQMSLMSDDPYFAEQWGLENKPAEPPQDYRFLMDEMLYRMPPHLRMLLEANPELMDLALGASPEELRDRLVAGGLSSGDFPPEMFLELADELFFRGSIPSAAPESQPAYACDADVVGAWEVSQGEGIVVAVIDTGIDIYHEDLMSNIWLNTAEVPGNGLDDDGNGYVDDVNGWNFPEINNIVFDSNNPSGDKHGTHVAGLIAAEKDNGKGIAGVAPEAKIMPLKVFESGTAYTSDIIAAIEYAESMGASIVNASWGSTADNPALRDAIEMSGMLFVCAAGNSGVGTENYPVYPAAFDLSNVIAVASVGRNGLLSTFSNYGALLVHVAAPGEDILSTTPGNMYEDMSGTSMSAAFVSGEAALLLSAEISLAALEIKDRITDCSDMLSSLTSDVLLGNKTNCTNAVFGTRSDAHITVGGSADAEAGGEPPSQSDEFALFDAQSTELLDVIQVAGGGDHSLALKKDATVWAWGNNNYGQLGDGTMAQRTTPAQVSGLTGVQAIASGASHSLALKEDGTVWAWGSNSRGQLGDGTTTQRTAPVQVSGLTGVQAIAGGAFYSLALKEDGTVWAWGDNGYGPLGNGTTTPVQVSGLTGVQAIAGGASHSLALKGDGTVWAWGSNGYGQLGDGTTTRRTAPVQVSGLTGVQAIACGYFHSLALKEDGTIWTWGHNNYGQLGDGTTTQRTTPGQVSGLIGAQAIVSGSYHNLALKGDGTVWAWGGNFFGQLGDGTITQKTTPVQMSGLAGVQAIACGYSHSLALKRDATVWAWGNNNYGQLGDGTMSQRTTPVQVSGLTGVQAIAGGGLHSLALKGDGTVWAWGDNFCGQLGDGTTTQRTTPGQVSGLTGVQAIAGGGLHSLALKEDGTIWAWGHNNYGQLGDGTTAQRTMPGQVSGLTGVTAIFSGQYHSLALEGDGTVWAWGDNYYGQLGDGTTVQRTTPVQVSGLTGVQAIAGGQYHSLALKGDGTVWAWGGNSYGQLGDGTTVQRTTPVQVSGLTGVQAISCGQYHSLAQKGDGTVWAWGYNFCGQLGDGTMTQRTTPVQVSGLAGVQAIAGGGCHSLALKEDGTVCAWGHNDFGQMGDGTTTWRIVPVQGSGLTGVQVIAGGGLHSLALKGDGAVWAWGDNSSGQLGDGRVLFAVQPMGLYGAPPAVSVLLTDTELSLSYSVIGGTMYYEVEVDGSSINNGKNTTYSYPISTPGCLPTYRIRSINESGPGLWSVNEPAAGTFVDITVDSIQVSWSVNGNPGDTQYKVAAFSNGLLVAESEWATNLSGIVASLTENTPYVLKVKAKNSDGVESDWHEIGPATTPFANYGAAPVVTAVLTDTELTLSYDSIGGTVYYEVEIDGVSINNGQNLTYDCPISVPGHVPTYRVRSVNQSGSGLWSVNEPAAGGFGAIAADSIEASWSANGNPTDVQYKLAAYSTGDLLVAENEWMASLSGIVAGLTENTSYILKVQARNSDGVESAWHEIGTAAPSANYGAAPAVTAVLTDTELTLSYNSIGGTVYYEVEIDGVSINNGQNLTYSYPVSVPGHVPTYRVRSANQSGFGFWSVNEPAAGSFGAITADSIEVSWSANGNPGDIQYKVAAFGAGDVLVTENEWTATLSGIIAGLTENTPYVLKVKARNSDGVESAWHEIGTAAPSANYGAAPAVTAVLTDTELTLSYNSIGGTVYYEVEIDGVSINNGQNLTYSYPVSVPGHVPTYRVRSANQSGFGFWSVNEPAAGSFGAITADSIEVSWSANGNPGDIQYKVAAFGAGDVLVTENEWTATLSGIIAGLTENTPYVLKVKARNSDGVESAWHEIGTAAPSANYGAAPAVTAVLTDTELTLSYNSIGGTVYYEVEIDGVSINNGQNLTYSYPVSVPGHVPTYRVRSANQSGFGFWSVNEPAAGSFGAITADSIEVSWSANGNPGDIQYKVAAFGAGDVLVTENEWTATLSGIIAGLTENTPYVLKVKAKNSDGVESAWHEIGTAAPSANYGAAPAVTAVLTDTELTLSYNSIGGTVYYEVEIDGVSINNGQNLTYSYPVSVPGYVPTYRVRSVNQSGFGLWSVNAPATGTFGTITADSIQASWLANGNPSGTLYKIAAFDSDNLLVTENDWVPGLSDTVAGLTEDVSYVIKVKAKNAQGVETAWYRIGTATPLDLSLVTFIYDQAEYRLVEYVEVNGQVQYVLTYDLNGNLLSITLP